ncbi:MAG: ATP-binding protein [Bacteroidales bacterium]|nr:ATP-binding protein [Bacteroidales bacterium]
MKSLIGRHTEIATLNTALNSQRAEFVALYGRRRVGKTFLINQMFEPEQFVFKMTGVIEGTLKDQFVAFADAMNDFGYEMPKQPLDWMEAFVMLKHALKDVVKDKERCIIFIDELPAMDAERSNVAAAVGYFWNQWASLHDNVMLIICGSATSWMIGNVINSKGGLHDRITIELPIHPFTLKETEEYIESQGFVWNRQMTLLAYMVFGGIPYYLSLLDKGESTVQNIDRLFFSRDTQMRGEFRRLFNTLYKNPKRYIELIKALGKSRQGMTRSQIA